MGRKCAVPHCYTGYRKCKEKASLYRVPDDDFFLTKWQEAIAREDRPITPKDYVCEKHFQRDDILRQRIIKDVVEEYQRPRLKPDAVPSIFPDLPEFILKMVKKRRKIMPHESGNTSSVDENKTESDINYKQPNEIKQEPVTTEVDKTVPEKLCETIMNNEIDIKTEPEEIMDQTLQTDGDNEREDATYGPKMHQCDECDYQTKYPHNLRTHKRKHLTGEEAYMHCDICPNFKTKWELTYRNHIKIKHGIGKQEVFRCSQCPFETKVKLCLKRHCERHKRGIFEKKYSCKFPECDYKDDMKSSLEIHMLSHAETREMRNDAENSKSFKCTECLYETNSKTHILKHIKSAHQARDDTIVSVNKQTEVEEECVASIIPQTKGKPMFKCLKCPYQSSSHAYLLKHVFKHKYPKSPIQKKSKAKIWKCTKCPYATFFQHALIRHHEECGKQTFSCTDCSFKSISKAEYIKHSLTHRNISIEAVNHDETIGDVTAKVSDQSDLHENTASESTEISHVEELVLVKVEVVDENFSG